MEIGWNRKYIGHRLLCRGGVARGARALASTAATVLMVFLFPIHGLAPAQLEYRGGDPASPATEVSTEVPEEFSTDPSVLAIEDLLARHTRVSDAQRLRIARAVVSSARRHDVDPFLVTGVLIAESGGDPYAISRKQAVGIMQIHVPTWGAVVEAEGLNLFLLEDNIDFGTRIIRQYTRRYGFEDGLRRYLGATEINGEAQAYIQRVQNIYSDRQAD